MNFLRQNVAMNKLYTLNDEWAGSSPCHFKPIGIKIIPQILHKPREDGGRMHYYVNKESQYVFSFKGKKPFTDKFRPNNQSEKESKYLTIKLQVYHSRINPYKLSNIQNHSNTQMRNGIRIIEDKTYNQDSPNESHSSYRNKGLYFSTDLSNNSSYQVREQLMPRDLYDRQYVSNLDKFDYKLNKK
jgi:hypothetical protein